MNNNGITFFWCPQLLSSPGPERLQLTGKMIYKKNVLEAQIHNIITMTSDHINHTTLRSLHNHLNLHSNFYISL